VTEVGRSGPLEIAWLGRVAYARALDLQRGRRDLVIAGRAPEALWLLEHDAVVTVGRRPAPGVPDAATLAARGIAFHETERGGLATWHGPGQLVVYAIVDAWGRGLGVRGLVRALEQGAIDWLGDQGVDSGRREGFPGVWTRQGKVCAVGLHVRRGVSMHGLALNLDPDLDAFALFPPCGLTAHDVTSMERVAGRAPSPAEAAPSLAQALARRLTGPLVADIPAAATGT
jgi:lipoate-protein ligase B